MKHLLAPPLGPVLGLALLIAASAAASRAEAAPARDEEAGAALVTGQVAAHHRDVVRIAIEEELRSARWTLREIESAEASRLASCFAAEHPWPCLLPAAEARGVTRLLAIRVEREPSRRGAQLRLTGQLGAVRARRITVDARYCGPCGAPQLAAAARQLARQLLAEDAVRGDATRIELRTTPPGAVILLDGRMVETAGDALVTSPGWHTVHLQLAGYRPELRRIHVVEGKAAQLEVSFVAAERMVQGASVERHALESAAVADLASGGRSFDGARVATAPLDDGAAAQRDPTTPAAATATRMRQVANFGATTDEARTNVARRRRLGWALVIGGGALLAAGGVLLALDEDAEADPSRRHHPQYFDSAPTGLALAVSGATFAAAGVAVVLLSPLPAGRDRAAPPAGLAVVMRF